MDSSDLYQSLLKLSEDSKLNADDTFYFRDEINPSDGYKYRTFLYRLASYSDFQKPGALESRGIVFRLEPELKLVSRPFEKFFNLSELVIDKPDITKTIRLENKFDGSLIKTFIDYNGNVRFASKGALQSEQAVAAQQIFDSWPLESQMIVKLFAVHYTFLFEYISPTNQVIIKYDKPELKLLAVRNTETGEYLNFIQPDHIIDKELIAQELELVYDSTRINFEGYVGILESGQRFKVKTNRYVALHRLKEDVSSVSKMIDVILDENYDDVVSSFKDFPEIVNNLTIVNESVKRKYNHLVSVTESLVKENLELDRRSFAIKYNTHKFFSAIMQLYLGNKPDYKRLFKKLYEDEIKYEFENYTL